MRWVKRLVGRLLTWAYCRKCGVRYKVESTNGNGSWLTCPKCGLRHFEENYP